MFWKKPGVKRSHMRLVKEADVWKRGRFHEGDGAWKSKRKKIATLKIYLYYLFVGQKLL